MLTSSPLPPRGVFVPTAMLFHSQLPSSVLLTWIQLRALAWQGWSTPPLSLPEFASLLGIHPARLSRHRDQLQSLSALSVHHNGNDKLVLSFPPESVAEPGSLPAQSSVPLPPASTTHETSAREPASYFPRQILGYITYDEDMPPSQSSPIPTPVKETPIDTALRVNKLPSLSLHELA